VLTGGGVRPQVLLVWALGECIRFSLLEYRRSTVLRKQQHDVAVTRIVRIWEFDIGNERSLDRRPLGLELVFRVKDAGLSGFMDGVLPGFVVVTVVGRDAVFRERPSSGTRANSVSPSDSTRSPSSRVQTVRFVSAVRGRTAVTHRGRSPHRRRSRSHRSCRTARCRPPARSGGGEYSRVASPTRSQDRQGGRRRAGRDLRRALV